MPDRNYKGNGLTVHYNVRRCIHAEECVHGLPQVFDPHRRPWIDATQADNDALANVIQRCPTGALHYSRSDGGAEEAVPTTNTVHLAPDGPLYLRGDLTVTTPDGNTIVEDTRIALCRCGASKNKPFCDNSHLDIDFAADGHFNEVQVKATEGKTDAALRVQPSTNGPLLLQGRFTITDASGKTVEGGNTALCRCGGSQNKPFCDGSHRRLGFEG